MKKLKIGLIGIFVFIAPVLFYLQAAQQEKSEKEAGAQYLDLYKRFIRDSIRHQLQDSLVPKQTTTTLPATDNQKDILKKLTEILDSLKRKPRVISAQPPSARPKDTTGPGYSMIGLVDRENEFFTTQWKKVCNKQDMASTANGKYRDSVNRLAKDIFLQIDSSVQTSFQNLQKLPEAGRYYITLTPLVQRVHQLDLNQQDFDLTLLINEICSAKYPIRTFQINPK